jgi:hypothetical protein
MGSLALAPIGYLLSGPLGEAFGDRAVLLGGALGAFAALGGGLLVRGTWTMRRVERVGAAGGCAPPASTAAG